MNINRYNLLLQVMTMSSHTFLPHSLGSRPVVVDLGANRGDFFKAFSRRFKPAKYVAVEANPQLAEALRASSGLDVFNYAIAGTSRTLRFKLEENAEASHVTEDAGENTVSVEARTLEAVLVEADVERVDLLKVDIEGAEIPMLIGAPSQVLERIGQITIEFHDFCGISTRGQVRQTVRRLEESGFGGIRFSRDNTNWCFVRRDLPARNAIRFCIAKQITARLRRAKHAFSRSPPPL